MAGLNCSLGNAQQGGQTHPRLGERLSETHERMASKRG
jgi:hypothetical protein